VTFTRRSLITLLGGTLILPACAMTPKEKSMEEIEPGSILFGLVGQMKAAPGKRAELAAILAEGTRTMPGCLTYIIAEDLSDPDSLWITEVWTDESKHQASLKLPEVQAAIAKGRPLIAGFGTHVRTRPVAGVGI